MAKKKNIQYDSEGLYAVSRWLKAQRTTEKDVKTSKSNIDLDGLEKAIKKIPSKNREIVEKFFGLIPGTQKHYLRYYQNQKNKKIMDKSLSNMVFKADQVLSTLHTPEYMSMYDISFIDLKGKILSKFDTSKTTLSTEKLIQYFLMYIEVFHLGPRFPFDQDTFSKKSLIEEQTLYFDTYAILKETWETTFSQLNDKEFNIGLFINLVEILHLKDRVKLLQAFDLPIPKEMQNLAEKSKLRTFKELRSFKEVLFPYGSWRVFECLLYKSRSSKLNLNELEDFINKFRTNWMEKLSSCKTDETTSVVLPSGKKHYPIYRIGSIEFTDIEEIISLFLLRNCF